MQNQKLIPQRTVHLYQVSGPCYFAHEGKRVQAVELDLEEDVYNPDQFALQITTACNMTITFHGSNFDTWPLVAKRLFRQHVAIRRAYA